MTNLFLSRASGHANKVLCRSPRLRCVFSARFFLDDLVSRNSADVVREEQERYRDRNGRKRDHDFFGTTGEADNMIPRQSAPTPMASL